MDTVLVLHDDPIIRNQLLQALNDAQYLVLEAVGDDEALGLARNYSGRIDLLILEYAFVNGSLYEIVTGIKALQPHICFLLISDSAEQTAAFERTFSASIDQVLQKPYVTEALIERVRRVLTCSRSDVA